MTTQLLIAPASSGKTAYALNLVRDAARRLQSTPRVVVASYLQARSWRHRLAEAGGAIGVRVLTFDGLYTECLDAAGEAYTELSDPVQYRLVRAVVDDVELVHYAPLIDQPGFIQVLVDLIGELKVARIWPDAFSQAVGDEARLRELALVYAAYQERVQAQGWADRAGLGWLATEALADRAPGVGRDWPLLVVDGFDNFTPVQLALLGLLADRVEHLIVTLTGAADGDERIMAHQRLNKTRQNLEKALDVRATPLPVQGSHQDPALAHLEAGLFRSGTHQIETSDAIQLIEVPDRAAEVRAALRWLKARVVEGEMPLRDVALLARDITPYHPTILQIASEFGLPVRLVDGLPLRRNPAIAALLDLLRLMLPRAHDDLEPALPRRLLVEAWRSPYFDWSALPEEDATEPVGIEPGDAETLDAIARRGRVIGGLSQWEEVLDDLTGYSNAVLGGLSTPDGLDTDEERGITAGVPVGPAAQALKDKFHRFIRRLMPPAGEHSYREFVGWLESLIGPDLAPQSGRYTTPEEPTALQMVAQARKGTESIVERDVAALQALKDVLRGLVWAEEALDAPPVDFVRFFDELTGAVEAAFYRLPMHSDRQEILVAGVVQARGVPFRAVAVLGLAEGEFPTTLSEDPFLRDADRQHLREDSDLLLEPSTESAEAEFFYDTVTRPRDRLLLTRPRLADNGALWQASPFWEEVQRLVKVEVETRASESIPLPGNVASWPELMTSLAAHPGCDGVREWVRLKDSDRQSALEEAAHLFNLRNDHTTDSPHTGDLSGLAHEFALHFGPQHIWSASRLESYRTCPFLFFVSSVLGLEPREEPSEGLDARQLGNIYHHIFEQLYPTVADPADLDQLLVALPLAAQAVMDDAPRREGFRATAWWTQTRAEIEDNVRRSLVALAGMGGGFEPYGYELGFGLGNRPPLVVKDGDDHLRLRGLIDRVDRTSDGRIRVVDYKTGGPHAFTNNAVIEGKKLQLPLYALAARDALGLGEPVEGFYWHVRHAEPSGFSLGSFGPEEAMERAVAHAWEAVHQVRSGHFVPHPPDTGCPSYCPAVPFCWHYQSRFGG